MPREENSLYSCFMWVLGGYGGKYMYSICRTLFCFTNTIVSFHLCLKHGNNLSFLLKCIYWLFIEYLLCGRFCTRHLGFKHFWKKVHFLAWSCSGSSEEKNKQTMKLVKVCVTGLRAGKFCMAACRPLLLLPHCPVLPFHYLCFPILYLHLCWPLSLNSWVSFWYWNCVPLKLV